MDVQVRPLTGEDELEQAFVLSQQSFDTPARRRDEWMAVARALGDRLLGVVVDDGVAACSQVLEGGVHFGGRAVPAGLVAGVTVAPHHRGKGYGAAVVAATLPAMRARGEVISPLGPATTRLYRGLGWEIAGTHCWRSVPTRSLALLPGPAGAAVRPGTDADLPGIRDCYARVAAGIDGFLDRRDGYWADRTRGWWDPRHHVFVVEGDDGDLAGYVAYRHVPPPAGSGGFGLAVIELVASEPDATVALWRVLGSSATQVERVSYPGSPEDDLVLLLPEQDVRVDFELRWMLRIIDLEGAVEARGFPAGLSVNVDLDVADRHADWNTGRRRLVVDDGHGRIEHGGTGDVRINIGALAALYAGYAPARRLRRLGHLAGPDRPVARLDAAFAGPAPWMPDNF